MHKGSTNVNVGFERFFSAFLKLFFGLVAQLKILLQNKTNPFSALLLCSTAPYEDLQE